MLLIRGRAGRTRQAAPASLRVDPRHSCFAGADCRVRTTRAAARLARRVRLRTAESVLIWRRARRTRQAAPAGATHVLPAPTTECARADWCQRLRRVTAAGRCVHHLPSEICLCGVHSAKSTTAHRTRFSRGARAFSTTFWQGSCWWKLETSSCSKPLLLVGSCSIRRRNTASLLGRPSFASSHFVTFFLDGHYEICIGQVP